MIISGFVLFSITVVDSNNGPGKKPRHTALPLAKKARVDLNVEQVRANPAKQFSSDEISEVCTKAGKSELPEEVVAEWNVKSSAFLIWDKSMRFDFIRKYTDILSQLPCTAKRRNMLMLGVRLEIQMTSNELFKTYEEMLVEQFRYDVEGRELILSLMSKEQITGQLVADYLNDADYKTREFIRNHFASFAVYYDVPALANIFGSNSGAVDYQIAARLLKLSFLTPPKGSSEQFSQILTIIADYVMSDKNDEGYRYMILSQLRNYNADNLVQDKIKNSIFEKFEPVSKIIPDGFSENKPDE